jgi:hypothetical protein
VFTARYALSPYIKQIRFVFKGLILIEVYVGVCVLCFNIAYELVSVYIIVIFHYSIHKSPRKVYY